MKSIERLANCILNRCVRPLFALVTLLEIPAIWYSCSVLIHYYNDSFYDFYYSQLYYTLSEVAIYITATYLLDSKIQLPNKKIAFAVMGTAIYHMLQLNMDEPFLLFSPRPLRNILLFMPDLLTTINLWKIHSPVGKDGWFIIQAVIFNFLAFQLLFADKASFTVATT
jgi:hypothetical protein